MTSTTVHSHATTRKPFESVWCPRREGGSEKERESVCERKRGENSHLRGVTVTDKQRPGTTLACSTPLGFSRDRDTRTQSPTPRERETQTNRLEMGC